MAIDDDDRDREPGDDDEPPGYRIDYDPEFYDEYDDADFGFDYDLGDEEVY